MADYTYWQNALLGNFGPVHDGELQLGFWRKRISRDGAFVPVATFIHDGKLVALVNGDAVEHPEDLWTFICRNPIPEDWYHARMAGEPWPDEDGAVAKSVAPPPPPSGHNNPPQDEAEILKAQIDAASAGVSDYAEVSDDETAAKAQSLRSRLLELSREADKKRDAEKRPHLEAGKAIDAKFQPLVKAAKAAADAIAKALGAHETRKAREAAEAAMRAEEARQKALAEQLAKHPEAPPPEPVAPPQPIVAPAPIKGAYGRAATVKVVKVATVTDQDAVYGYLKTHPEMIALITQLAQRAVNAGHTVPGVEVTEERKVS